MTDESDSNTPLQVQGEPDPRPWWAPWLHYTTTSILVAGGFLLAALVAVGTPGESSTSRSDSSDGFQTAATVIEQSRSKAQRRRIRLALDIYAIGERGYPVELRALAAHGLLASSDLYYASGRPRFDYIVDEGRLRLEPVRRRSEGSESPPDSGD